MEDPRSQKVQILRFRTLLVDFCPDLRWPTNSSKNIVRTPDLAFCKPKSLQTIFQISRHLYLAFLKFVRTSHNWDLADFAKKSNIVRIGTQGLSGDLSGVISDMPQCRVQHHSLNLAY